MQTSSLGLRGSFVGYQLLCLIQVSISSQANVKTVGGDIYVDDKNISTLNIAQYRRLFALVSQEPTLYQGSIRDNVLLGTDEEDPDSQSLFRACKDADIYDFIMSLP